jgi:hypothetical protein
MSEIKPTPGGQTIIDNSKEIAPLTASDIEIIKSKFKKKRKIAYYCMIIFLTAGILLTTYAVTGYGFSRLENFVPLIVGFVAVLICALVLVMFSQEVNLELKNNQKYLYKGIVSQRSEKSTRMGTGQNRQTYSDYFIWLGDEIRFEHQDLYFEVNVGDTIDVQISEKLKIVLYKNIQKKKSVSDVIPEVLADYGIVQEIKEKHQVKEREDFLSEDELTALKAQKHRRIKRILPVAIIFLFGFGICSEIILLDDYYSLDEILAIRIGFWGSPVAFFGLLLLRKLAGLSKDIKEGKKIIVTEKLINKDQYTWASSGETDYFVVGLTGKTRVSKEFFNSLTAGDDFELHKTKVRKKQLAALNPKSGIKYLNSEIFKTIE